MKPPVGVIPRKLWLETRIQDLVRAINEYTQAGIREPVYEWSKEMIELIRAKEELDISDHTIFPVMPTRKEEAEALFEPVTPHYSEVYVNGQWGPSPIAPMVDILEQEARRSNWYKTLNRPEVVCLCGSTRFYKTFAEWTEKLTLEGKIVLGIGSHMQDDKTLGLTNNQVKMLLQLHRHKIDLADEVLIINKGGYIGKDTRNEINYAISKGKRVSFIEGGEGVE
jgi:hypothetical protein